MKAQYLEIMTSAKIEKVEELVEGFAIKRPAFSSSLITLFSAGDLVISCEPNPGSPRYKLTFPGDNGIATPRTRISVGDPSVYSILGMIPPKPSKTERDTEIATQLFGLLAQQGPDTHLYHVSETRQDHQVTDCKAKTLGSLRH
jgi:hypothetical protein